MLEPGNIQHIFLEEFWRGLEPGAPVAIGCLVMMWVVGLLSRWLIGKQPDFTLKQQMASGVWWFPAQVIAVALLGTSMAYLGIKYTDYPLSFMVSAVPSVGLLLHLTDRLVPRAAFLGWSAVFHVGHAYVKRETVDWEGIVAARERRRETRAFKTTMVFVWLIMVGAPAFLVTKYTLPADQMLAGTRQLFRLEERVTQRLQDPIVTAVVVRGPPIMDERKVFVQVKKGASDQQILEVHRQAWKIMAQLDPEHVWQTIVGREPDDEHRPTTPPPHPRN